MPVNFALAGLVSLGVASLLMPHHYPGLALPLVVITALATMVDCVAYVEREYQRLVADLRWNETHVLPVVGAEHHEAVLLEGAMLRQLAATWRYRRHLRDWALLATVATGLLGVRAIDLDMRSALLLAQAVLFVALLAQAQATFQAHQSVDTQRMRLASRLAQTGPAPC